MLAGPMLRARLLFKFRRTHDPACVRPPGEYSSYSNYGATLAGYIVERVSGLPYDDYVGQNILTPLIMVIVPLGTLCPIDGSTCDYTAFVCRQQEYHVIHQ